MNRAATGQPAQARATPRVTICVPTIGRLEYLNDCLRSIDSQTYTDCEVLILDNASAQDARQLFDDFASTRPNVKILRAEPRVPMFANFNRGIEAAEGEYIAFFHDDDYYAPDFLTAHVALLERFPTAGVAAGNFDVIDAHGTLVRRDRQIRRTALWSGRTFMTDLLRNGRSAFSTPAAVYRTSVLRRIGFAEDLSIHWGDCTVLMRLAEMADVAVLAQTRYAWRVHGQNGSSIPLSFSIPTRTRVLHEYLSEYQARHDEDETFVRKLRGCVRRHHRFGLLWGWMAAPDGRESELCVQQLLASPGDRMLGRALLLLERLGLSAGRRQKLRPVLHRVRRWM